MYVEGDEVDLLGLQEVAVGRHLVDEARANRVLDILAPAAVEPDVIGEVRSADGRISLAGR